MKPKAKPVMRSAFRIAHKKIVFRRKCAKTFAEILHSLYPAMFDGSQVKPRQPKPWRVIGE
jgi:hypothetical protein